MYCCYRLCCYISLKNVIYVNFVLLNLLFIYNLKISVLRNTLKLLTYKKVLHTYLIGIFTNYSHSEFKTPRYNK